MPVQPPEGKLLAQAAARAGFPIAQAARRAGISYRRWHQITTGSGHRPAPARTVARMAAAVGVTPRQLETDGHRHDAAEILRDMARPCLSVVPPPPPAPAADLPLTAVMAAEPGMDQAVAQVSAERASGGWYNGDLEELRIWGSPAFSEDTKRVLVAYRRVLLDKGTAAGRAAGRP